MHNNCNAHVHLRVRMREREGEREGEINFYGCIATMRQQVRVAINEWLILAVIDSFMYCERGNKSLMSVRVVVNSLILSSRGKIAFLNAKLNRDRKSLDWNHRAKKKSCIVLKIHFCNF